MGNSTYKRYVVYPAGASSPRRELFAQDAYSAKRATNFHRASPTKNVEQEYEASIFPNKNELVLIGIANKLHVEEKDLLKEFLDPGVLKAELTKAQLLLAMFRTLEFTDTQVDQLSKVLEDMAVETKYTEDTVVGNALQLHGVFDNKPLTLSQETKNVGDYKPGETLLIRSVPHRFVGVFPFHETYLLVHNQKTKKLSLESPNNLASITDALKLDKLNNYLAKVGHLSFCEANFNSWEFFDKEFAEAARRVSSLPHYKYKKCCVKTIYLQTDGTLHLFESGNSFLSAETSLASYVEMCLRNA